MAGQPESGLRVLVLSADVGESHSAMARVLGEQLRARPDVEAVSWVDDFSVLGPTLGSFLPRSFRFHLGRVKWSYDLTYKLFTRIDPARRFGESALYRLGAGALERTVVTSGADVVVSTYPVMTSVLARLRIAGRLRCPVAAVVGPLGGLHFWVQPGADLHLAMYPEAVPEIERLAGPGRVRVIRPLVREEFYEPRARDEARDALGLDRSQLVLVSGGGWGAGDVSGAIDAALASGADRAIAVAGRNRNLATRLTARYAGDRRVTVLGFTDRMRDLLCAADAFVAATGGLSCIESRLCGCPTICYGFAIGHVRDNIAALADHGLARTASTTAALARELRHALAAGRTPIPRLDELPAPAELVVKLARPVSAASRR